MPTIWELQDSNNIQLDAEALKTLGADVYRDFDADKNSRQEWDERMENAIKLALQMKEEKSTPWRGASNVKFPLITIAALQFSARATPALIKSPDIVKFRVNGADQEGQKAARASRISKHMSYQLAEQDEGWEEDQDKLFIVLPIVGCAFKKSFFDPLKQVVRSKLVLPNNLYVHYYADSIENCERKTEVFELYQREIKERQLRGLYNEVELPQSEMVEHKLSDERQGITPPSGDKNRAREILEQHCYLDLDEDGYPEPYVVTVDRTTKKVLRIVSRFAEVETEQSLQIDQLVDQLKALEIQIKMIAQSVPPPTGDPQQDREAMQIAKEAEQKILQLRQQQEPLKAQVQQLQQSNQTEPKILRIVPREHYTKYGLIPSPDGGFYDLGLGALLGPINDSVNTLINQLIDSGTLQNGSSGFIGKGARIKGGLTRFQPFEWKRVNVAGSTLRDSLVPLPVNGPSNVLFSLLSLLISYGERVASVSEQTTGGNPGQNTPASSYQSMLEQGLQLFNGIFKRCYRSFRKELKCRYVLNRIYLNPIEYFETMDGPEQVLQDDYQGDEKDVFPASDPNAFSNMESQMKAHFLAERSMTVPGYNPTAVERRLLESMDIPDVQEIFPVDEKGQAVIQPPPNPEIEIKIAEEQRRHLEGKARVEIQTLELQDKMDVNESVILLNRSKASQLDNKTVVDKFDAITRRASSRQEHVAKLVEMMAEDNNEASSRSGDGE